MLAGKNGVVEFELYNATKPSLREIVATSFLAISSISLILYLCSIGHHHLTID